MSFGDSYNNRGYSAASAYSASWDVSPSGHFVSSSAGPSSYGASGSTSHLGGYDPLNPGYDAGVGNSYANPGYSTYMGTPSPRTSQQPRAPYRDMVSALGNHDSREPQKSYFTGASSWRSGSTADSRIFKGANVSFSFQQQRQKPQHLWASVTTKNTGNTVANQNTSKQKQKKGRKVVTDSSSGESKQDTNPVPHKIIPASTESRGNKKPKGKGGVQKSPPKQKQGKMNGFTYGRAGYGGGGGGYGNKKFGGPRKKFFKKRDNEQDDIPFTPIPEGEPFTAFPISADNIHCFHGFQSIFTTQHSFPVLIDGHIYESCDHYYQIEKTKQLCGSTSEKMTATVRDSEGKRLDGKVGFRSHEEKSFSALAKEMIRLNNVPKEKVEEWRHTKGLEIMQKALSCKVSQCPEMREALHNTGDKILIHTYAGDAIYGAGTRFSGVKQWCDDMKTNEGKLMVPMRFPLTEETVYQCPVVGKGRNILGVIMMQLRHQVRNNDVSIRDMSVIFDALRGGPGGDASKDLLDDDEMNGFNIGGGSIQPPIGSAL